MKTSVPQSKQTDDPKRKNADTHLVVQSSLGEFHIHLCADAAPETCRYFLNLVSDGAFLNAGVFRIVTDQQAAVLNDESIHVVQVGTRAGYQEQRTQIQHEDTRSTGLKHHRYTVSAARYGAGEVYGSFFICMRDEPALDYGGMRHPDGLGFAAFGEVVAGCDVIERINQCAEQNDLLSKKVAIDNISVPR